MMVKAEEVTELFKSKKFREASIHFFRERRSVTSVEELTGISRTTIYKFFKKFKATEITPSGREIEHYDEKYLNWRGTKEKNYQFTQRLLADWLSAELDFSGKEKKALIKILNEEKVGKIIRDSESWEVVIAKIIFSAIFIKLRSEFGKTSKFLRLPTFINAEFLQNLNLFERYSKEEIEFFFDCPSKICR